MYYPDYNTQFRILYTIHFKITVTLSKNFWFILFITLILISMKHLLQIFLFYIHTILSTNNEILKQ